MRRSIGRFVAGTLFLALATAPLALASDLTIPNTFVNGTIADADDVNANFEAVEDAVDDNDSRLQSLEQSVVSFHAVVSPANLASSDTLVFDNEIHDEGDAYDPITGVYTVPEDGLYQFNFFTSFISTGIISMLRNGQDSLGSTWAPLGDSTGTIVVTTLLSQGDTVELVQTPNNGNTDVTLWGTTARGFFTSWSGHRVGQ